MNALIGQGGEERVIPAEGASAPVDLAPQHAAFADVLEASVPHEAGGEHGWREAAPETGHAPGPLFLHGSLYCCGEDGRILRGTEAEGLAFGEDGRYSCGDEELDAYVCEILATLCDEYPEDADVSHSGKVYYVSDGEPMDVKEYEKWYASWHTDLVETEVPMQALTAENIEKLEE
jgi:hypothetical protein